MAAVRVAFCWFGVRKTLTPQQKAQAADTFGAEGRYLSAGKKLLDTRHPAFLAVTNVRHQLVATWQSMSLPYPEPAIRLIRQDKIDEFNRRMTELRQDVDEAVSQLDVVAGLRPSHGQRPKVSRKRRRPDDRAFRPGRSPALNAAASVATDGDFQGAITGRLAPADFCHSAEDRGVEVTGSALVADADRHVFQDHKIAFVTQRFPLDSPRLDLAATVFAGEIVHGLIAT